MLPMICWRRVQQLRSRYCKKEEEEEDSEEDEDEDEEASKENEGLQKNAHFCNVKWMQMVFPQITVSRVTPVMVWTLGDLQRST